MIFYLKHTKGKSIFSNFSSSKLFYGNLRYETKVHNIPNKYLIYLTLINMAPLIELILLCKQKIN